MTLPQQYREKECFTEDEYFEFSQTAEERWEFIPVGPPGADGSSVGVLRAMSGGTDDHAAIIGNVLAALHTALRPQGCRVYVADMRVHTGSGRNTFPDVAVVCGPRQYHRGRKDTLTNPILVVEVLSPSTAGYDLGDKFVDYQIVPTLADYLLVAQDTARAILHSRAGDHWETRLFVGLESRVALPSVGVTLALADIYALIEFADAKPAETED